MLIGGLAGVLAGLLGVGGGLVIVPLLVLVFVNAGLPEHSIMHLALGTSLASIIITGLSSVRAHHKRGAVRWLLVASLAPGLLIGASLGAWLADQLSSSHLQRVFAGFAILVAVYMMVGAPTFHGSGGRGLSRMRLGVVGTFIGTVSSLLGIGGGTMTVPYLVWQGVSIRNAVAVSAACGVPIALAGAGGYLVTGLNTPDLPDGAVGYIYLPALLALVSTSLFTAPFGARLAHMLPVNALKRIFGGLLLLMGGMMLFESL